MKKKKTVLDSERKITLSLTAVKMWPNGKPIRSDILNDGKTRHLLEDGRAIIVSEPNYRLEYRSSWVGAEADETYHVSIAIIGPSSIIGFYEVWNFDSNEVRNYSFAKTKRIVHLTTGQVFIGAVLQELLIS
jgi:hypothetical protein